MLTRAESYNAKGGHQALMAVASCAGTVLFAVIYWLMRVVGLFGAGQDFELLPTIFQGVVFGLIYVGLMKLTKKKFY